MPPPTRVRATVPRVQAQAFPRELRSALAGGRGSIQLGNARINKAEIRNVFFAWYLKTLWTKIHVAYTVKSKGGVDDLGIQWPPLQDSTIQSRPKDIVGRRRSWILRVKDRIYKASRPGRAGSGKYEPPAGQIFRIRGTRVEFGISTRGVAQHYKYHHRGTRNIPARPLWPGARKRAPWVVAASRAGAAAVVRLIARRVG